MKKIIYIILIIGITLWIFWKKQNPEIISPLATDKQIFKFTDIFGKKNIDMDDLIPEYKKIIENEKGTYSIYVVDITNQKSIGINETTAYTAASLNKLPILASLYYQSQLEEIDLDERITVQKKDLQNYGTGIIQSEGAGGVYSLKNLAKLMIEKSDNTAAYILDQKIGQEKIQNLINKWGLIQTDMKNNKTSNKDMALLLTKMYQGKIVNQALTIEMLGFMDESDFENRLSGELPEKTKVYHKIGTEIGFIHDVGIIEINKYPYYVGVLSSDIKDEVQAEKTIAKIAKITYDFLQNEF